MTSYNYIPFIFEHEEIIEQLEIYTELLEMLLFEGEW